MPGLSLSSIPLLYSGSQWLTIVGLILVGLGFKALVAWWVYRDAEARGANARAWLIAAIVTALGTSLVWLIMRPAVPRRTWAPAPVAPLATAPPAHPDTDPYTIGFGAAGQDPRTAGLPGVRADDDADRGAAEAAAGTTVTVTCPRCQHRVSVTRNPVGPTPLHCDNCGATGRL